MWELPGWRGGGMGGRPVARDGARKLQKGSLHGSAPTRPDRFLGLTSIEFLPLFGGYHIEYTFRLLYRILDFHLWVNSGLFGGAPSKSARGNTLLLAAEGTASCRDGVWGGPFMGYEI